MSKVNLSNLDLSQIDFTGSNFRGANLDGANFRKSILNNVDLRPFKEMLGGFMPYYSPTTAIGTDFRKSKLDRIKANLANFSFAKFSNETYSSRSDFGCSLFYECDTLPFSTKNLFLYNDYRDKLKNTMSTINDIYKLKEALSNPDLEIDYLGNNLYDYELEEIKSILGQFETYVEIKDAKKNYDL